jgi:predicted RNA methylase
MAKKSQKKQKEHLFEEKLVPAKSGSGELFDVSFGDEDSGPVECLGMTFDNDQARRDYFIEKLREKLNDPEFRKIEGFPIGEDEDILALSDPPYYTACPNPFLKRFVEDHEDSVSDDGNTHHREPFAADVSGGKNNPIYNAHSYHTKVPHEAIMRYILHYTRPGDVILDGFCGTGMTGVAAHLCGDRSAVESLGYSVENDGSIIDGSDKVSRLGQRKAILADLAPAATFIASNYTSPVLCSGESFDSLAKGVLDAVEHDYGHLFLHANTISTRSDPLDYSVWSDVFVCPHCATEMCYWDVSVDTKAWKIRKTLNCPNCGAEVRRNDLDRAWTTSLDKFSGKTVRRAKKLRVWDVWRNGRTRSEGPVQPQDRTYLDFSLPIDVPDWCPTDEIAEGDKTSDPFGSGISMVHQYWTPRTCAVLSAFRSRCENLDCRHLLLFLLTSALDRVSIRNGYRPQHKNNKSRELGGPLPGNLYIPIFSVELNPIRHLRGRIKNVMRMLDATRIRGNCMVTTQSTSSISLPPMSLDYIFVDPPFGSNLMYSELSFALESWLRVKTNCRPEAIVNSTQRKSESDYTHLMTQCFEMMFQALKPGRWITVEFHNSKNSIWTSIQEALNHAGFVVADVRTLSRNLASLNQLTSANAVKQDLIISAYRPTISLEEEFSLEAGSDNAMWMFVEDHLRQLPIYVSKKDCFEAIAERQQFLLYDRMVAFHVQRGATVPLSAAEFYGGLRQRFPLRDDMYFLSEQAAKYDRERLSVREVIQLELFVSNEASAIQWLKQQVSRKPQSFQELQPQFMREVSGWEKHEKALELAELLDQNFLCYDGSGDVPSQVHSYLSSNFKELRNLDKDEPKLIAKAKNRWYVPDPRKEADLEKIRHRALMKEFEEYEQSKGKLKIVRTEALRAGFKESWQNSDYSTIVEMAKRVKDDIIQEDPALLMYYDNALMRTEE